MPDQVRGDGFGMMHSMSVTGYKNYDELDKKIFNTVVDALEQVVLPRFNAVDKRLDGMDKRLSGVEDRLDGVEEKLDAVEERLDGVEGELKIVRKS